jgi:hypothetical protein
VRKMSEAKIHVIVEQRIIIKLLMKEDCKPSEICSSLKRHYGEKTLSNVRVYKLSSAFKKGRGTVENEPHERRPRTSITLATKYFFLSGIRKLPGRWRKCIANRGDYVEK